MVKKLIIVILFIINGLFTHTLQVSLIYNGDYITINLINSDVLEIKNEKGEKISFNALKFIDQSQTHRVLLTTLEKSRLLSLFYIGDKYEFNNVELQLLYNMYEDAGQIIHKKIYRITDASQGITIFFSLGFYDNIIIHSMLNFGKSDINILDNLATTFTVKYLLKKMTGKLKKYDEEDEGKQERDPLNKTFIFSEYDKFVKDLEKLKDNGDQEVIEYLKKFVEFNFQLNMKKNSILDDWIHPANLYFYKEGDYKSFALFYYHTLSELGFNVRAYFVSSLIRKDEDDLDEMKNIFEERNPSDIVRIENQYRNVNKDNILKDFSDPYLIRKMKRPPEIFFYYPPDFRKSVYIITVQMDNRWIYTTGKKWIDAGILSPEAVCSHYSVGGCYYTYFSDDSDLMNNQPIIENNLKWDVFFPIK